MTTTSPQAASTPRRSRRRGFLGEPAGLGVLAVTELGERFSYYGMAALLALYMTQVLFAPGGPGPGVFGLDAVRAALALFAGARTPAAQAAEIYGLYSALIYFSPVVGGALADRWIGRRTAVVAGGVLMCLGHFAMSLPQAFLIALALIVTGCGLLKGNISAQVGGLYAETDAAGRSRGFSIFSMAINLGAVFGPLACGAAAALAGWSAGFALAGMLMALALVVYLVGSSRLNAPAQAERATRGARARRTPGQGRTELLLLAVMGLTVFQSVAYFQNNDVGLIWIARDVNLDLGDFHIPVSWFASIDPAASVLAAPAVLALWARSKRRGREPDELAKIATGAALAALANLLLAGASLFPGKVTPLAPALYDVLLGVAFLYYWPTLLSLVSRRAPPRRKSTMIGACFVSIFVADLAIGWLGARFEAWGAARFWLIHAAVAFCGAAATWLAAPALRSQLAAAHAADVGPDVGADLDKAAPL